jgi:hypothetical protein
MQLRRTGVFRRRSSHCAKAPIDSTCLRILYLLTLALLVCLSTLSIYEISSVMFLDGVFTERWDSLRALMGRGSKFGIETGPLTFMEVRHPRFPPPLLLMHSP